MKCQNPSELFNKVLNLVALHNRFYNRYGDEKDF